MKNIKHIITLILLTASTFVFAQKTAFINESKLLKATPGYEQAIAQMDTLKNQMQQELQTTQALLSTKISNLLKPYNFTTEVSLEEVKAKLSEIDKKKFDLLQEENQLLDKQAKAKEEEYQAAYKEKVGTILEKVNQTVKNYCKKNKIDVLYKMDQLQSAIAYYDESKEVTEIIIKLVNENLKQNQ